MAIFGNHTLASAFKRLVDLLRGFGVVNTLSVCVWTLDDQHLRSFDRRYGVRTSGYVSLASTSVDRAKLRHATSYGPVNAWAFRRLLRNLSLPRTLHFADLGCGLGRACILAAEYGFEKVTGVELAPELCVVARENMSCCRLPESYRSRIKIVEGDVLDYCAATDDDVFFVYRAFSVGFFRRVLTKLAEGATRRRRPLTIIYTERLSWPPSDGVKVFSEDQTFRKVDERSMFGQAFHVYECSAKS